MFYRYIAYFIFGYVGKMCYLCTYKGGDSPRLGQILEFMVFSKAIQIKSWVNRFNADRKFYGRQAIVFDCAMFSIGQWAVTLSAPDGSIFYSNEMERLCTLVAGGGLTFWVGHNTFAPVLYFQ